MAGWDITVKAVGRDAELEYTVVVRGRITPTEAQTLISSHIHSNWGMVHAIEEIFAGPRVRRSTRSVQAILVRAAIAGHMARLFPAWVTLTAEYEEQGDQVEDANEKQRSHDET
ncbi:MAG: hypothetical protein QM692_08100 [Thermomicrobiales bacterium]